MYQLLTAIVVLFAFLGYMAPRYDKILFRIEMLIMTLMLCFRYGQGTDYFGYEVNYSLVPEKIDFYFLFHNDVHGEIGFQFLCEIFRSFHAPFYVVSGFIGLITMLLAYKGINKYGKVKTIAAMLLYPTYYLTYFYGVREGIALAFVLGLILPDYLEKKRGKAIIWTLIGCGFHKSLVIVLAVIIFGDRLRKYRNVIELMSIFFAFVLAGFLKTTEFRQGYIYFRPSYPAIILRIILFIAIKRLYTFSRVNESDDYINDRLYDYYFWGFCIYIALCPMDFISGRGTAYMKIAECILFSRLLGNMKVSMFKIHGFIIMKRHVCMLIMAICMVEGLKNLNSYIGQGEYYSTIHLYNYPYVSIFNKEDIYKYRENEFLEKFPQVFE